MFGRRKMEELEKMIRRLEKHDECSHDKTNLEEWDALLFVDLVEVCCKCGKVLRRFDDRKSFVDEKFARVKAEKEAMDDA